MKLNSKSPYYILDKKGEVKGVDSVMEWAKWFETNPDRHIGLIKIFGRKVSTVFLGLDYGCLIGANNLPVVWETMIFGGIYDQYQERYVTKREALRGHWFAVWLVMRSSPFELYLEVKSLLTKLLKKNNG